jgi:hypothetical protein
VDGQRVWPNAVFSRPALWGRGPVESSAGRPRRRQPAALVIDRSRRRGGTRGRPLPCVGIFDALGFPSHGRGGGRSGRTHPRKPPARRKPHQIADYRTRPTPRRVANSGSVARKSGFHFSGSAARQGRKAAGRPGRAGWVGMLRRSLSWRPLTLPLSPAGRGDDAARPCPNNNPRPGGERVAGRPVRGRHEHPAFPHPRP